MKKANKKSLMKELDKLWSLAVKKADKGLCQWCKDRSKITKGVNAHHIIPRSRGKSTRWELGNGIYLCFYCHHRRILDEPIEYAGFIISWMGGQTLYDDLKAKSKIIKKWTLDELLEKKEELKKHV